MSRRILATKIERPACACAPGDPCKLHGKPRRNPLVQREPVPPDPYVGDDLPELEDDPHLVTQDSYAAARATPLDGGAKVWRCPAAGCGALEYQDTPSGMSRYCLKSRHVSDVPQPEPVPGRLQWTDANRIVMYVAAELRGKAMEHGDYAPAICGVLLASEMVRQRHEGTPGSSAAHMRASALCQAATDILVSAPDTTVAALCAVYGLPIPEAVQKRLDSTLRTS